MKKPALFLVVIFLFLSPWVQAQEKTDSIPPQVYPLIEVGPNYSKLKASIKKLKAEDEVESIIKEFRVALEEVGPDLDSLEVFTEYLLTYEIEQSKLNDAKSQWNRYQAEIEKMNSSISSHSKGIENDIKTLKEDLTIWVRTRDLPRELEIAELTKNQIDTAILILNQTINDLNDSLIVLIDFSAQIQKLGSGIQKYQTKVLEFQANYLTRIFEKTSPAIWEDADTTDSLSVQYLDARKLMLTNIQDTRTYTKKHWDYFIWMIVFTLLVRYMIYRSPPRESLLKTGHLSIQGHFALFEHPWVSSFIASLLLTLIFMVDNPPELFSTVIFFFLIIATFFLKGIFLPIKGWRLLPIALLPVFLLGVLVQLWVIDVDIKRTWFIVFNIYVLLALLLSFREIKKEKGVLSGNEQFFFFLYFSAIGLSLIFNLSGYLRAALYGQRAFITSFYIFYILIILIGLSQGLVQILMRSPLLQSSRVVKEYSKNIRKWIFNAITILFGFLAIRGILRSFILYDILTTKLTEFIEKDWEVGTSRLSIESVLLFFLILIVSFFVSSVIKVLLEKEILGRMNLKKGVPVAVALIVRYTMIVIGFFFAIGATEIDLDRIGFVAGALGVGIGFGLQNVVANFISGLILVFERPVNKGDTVTVGNRMGKVLSVGIRSSTIRTFDGAEVIVPNNDLIAKEVINWTLSDTKRRIELHIPVAFENDPLTVAKVIEESAAQVPEIMENPSPNALFVGYENGVLNFRVLIWTNGDVFVAESKGGMFIHAGLTKAGIKIEKPNLNIDLSENPGIGKDKK